MRVRQRLLLSAMIPVVTACLVILMLFLALYHINRAMKAQDLAVELIAGSLERTTFRNDYVRNNTDRARIQWFAKHEQIGALLTEATGVFTDREASGHVAEMLKSHESIVAIFSRLVENRQERQKHKISADLAAEVENRLLSQLNVKVYDTVLHGRQLQELSRDALFSTFKVAGTGIVGVFAIVITAAILGSISMGRGINNRIDLLREGALIIGGGNLDHRIEVQGDDEFAELSRAFNTMAAKLKELYRDLEKEIEERARVEEELQEIAIQRMKAQRELQRAHDRLEMNVRERTEDLAKTIDVLREEIAQREQAESSLQRLNRLYLVLSEIDKVIVRATDHGSLFRDFCRIAVDHGGFLLCWVGLIEEGTGCVNIVASHGATAYLEGIRITVDDEGAGQGPTGIAVTHGIYYICNDFLNDPATIPWQDRARTHGIRASASIALRLEGKVIGALTLYSGQKNFFDQQHVDLIKQMGTDISFALDNLKLQADRRQAERALQLETEERLRAMEELREKEQLLMQQSRQAALGEMIGNIAHQWRQPLNMLGLIIQELPLMYKRGKFSEEYLRSNVEKGKEIIFHMSDTIDDFRNFFKPDKEKVLFAADQVINRAVDMLRGGFRSHRIVIEVETVGAPQVLGYPNEFSQVLLNILGNARDAFIDRKIAEPRIHIKIFTEGERTVVTVADNAGGIHESILYKIFDPYFTTKGPDKGTGIGLYMSKTIIEKNMGGRLTARNLEGGVEFRVEI